MLLFSMDFVYEFLQVICDAVIIDCRGELIFLLVVHLANDVAEILACSSFGEFFYDMADFEASNWTNFFTDKGNELFLQDLRIYFMTRFHCYKAYGHLSLNLIKDPYNDCLSNMWMHH